MEQEKLKAFAWPAAAHLGDTMLGVALGDPWGTLTARASQAQTRVQ